MSGSSKIGSGYFKGIDSTTMGKKNIDRIGMIGVFDYMIGVFLFVTILSLFKRAAIYLNQGESAKAISCIAGIVTIATGIVFYFSIENNITGYFSKISG